MKKAHWFGLMVALFLLISFSNEAYSQPTFTQGYTDGFNEGRSLALAKDFTNYQMILASYIDYPNRFPDHPENFEYFAGKAWGLYEGWSQNFVPEPNGPDLRDLRDPIQPPYTPHQD